MICIICTVEISEPYEQTELCKKCYDRVEEIKKRDNNKGTPEKIKCSWE